MPKKTRTKKKCLPTAATIKASEALLIFVKNPVPGQVKTRLARDIGEENATAVYSELLRYTMEISLPLECVKRVYYNNEIDENDNWAMHGYDQSMQAGGSIGERMASAFRESLENGRFEKVVIIGSDCPQITTHHIEDAFQLLEVNDLVLGPALDGGYYLIGLRHFYPVLFTGIEWSSERVHQQTTQRARTLKISIANLEVLRDLDTIEDLKSIEWLNRFL